MFSVIGKESKGNVIEDLADVSKRGSNNFSDISNGSWVTLGVEYKNSKGSSNSVYLISGRVNGINDSMRLTGTGLNVAKGYVLVSDLDFIDKLPVGSLFVPFFGNVLTPASVLLEDTWKTILSGSSGMSSLNVAKLAADLIDVKTGDSSTVENGYVPSPTAKINDRVRVDTAPVMGGLYSTATAKRSIADYISSNYDKDTPVNIFKNILSKFYLVCAPRTDGKADVIENNGWYVGDAGKAEHVGLNLVTAATAVDYSGVYPGFDAVVVNMAPESAKGVGSVATESQYITCAEVFDQTTKRAKLVHGRLKVSSDSSGMTVLTNSGGSFTVGKVKRAYLQDWMLYNELSEISGTSKENMLSSMDRIEGWAKFLAYNTYASINRINNRVSLDLRIEGYFSLSNSLGKIMSFNLPNTENKYYGRLTSIGLQISVGSASLTAKSTATFDCVRDEVDNKNLCIDFTVYGNNNGK